MAEYNTIQYNTRQDNFDSDLSQLRWEVLRDGPYVGDVHIKDKNLAIEKEARAFGNELSFFYL